MTKLPIHQSRQPEPAPRGKPQSPNRRAVEAVLRTATPANPLSAAQIAARTSIHVDLVRSCVSNICARRKAHNTTAGKIGSKYAWGPAPDADGAGTAPKQPRDPGAYDGRELRPYTGRPGAMDAFTLPSLQNGQRVPRKAPIIIAASGGVRMVGRAGIPADPSRKEQP